MNGTHPTPIHAVPLLSDTINIASLSRSWITMGHASGGCDVGYESVTHSSCIRSFAWPQSMIGGESASIRQPLSRQGGVLIREAKILID